MATSKKGRGSLRFDGGIIRLAVVAAFLGLFLLLRIPGVLSPAEACFIHDLMHATFGFHIEPLESGTPSKPTSCDQPSSAGC